ncbi:ATP-binding protein [Mycobacterium avium subsp. hominissuis]|nr:ATP-binding protein [Mycobacterium avium subsp. hominissuis]ATO71803.1 ATP-binding protein [Mycobacterium avium subsp. hominissuis]PBJ43142.1 ATP-binding protein [Mycobacterium avium subsp. hominissuis]PBJ67490.1 ATP-binding protein [Mycobacterium avium subsp. hominissuis]QBC16924.1 ATP-binding protein [Mycobacterium avium subsp. hominissuis]
MDQSIGVRPQGVRPVGLQVIDNASGMDSAAIDDAMTYARKREYKGRDLGHFGIGLKAASLSQANTLIVWSKRYGSPAVGRRLRKETIDTGPVVEEFSTADAAERLANPAVGFSMDTGTIVEWQDVQTFLTSSSEEEQQTWMNRTMQEVVTHLGLVLHRILERGDLALTIDTFDVGMGFPGPPRPVRPIDPFLYRGAGQSGYPKELPVDLEDATGTAQLHIWPYRDKGPGFVQGGRSETESQGLYIYRNDRLLQAGGWNGLATPSVDLAFARVLLDLTPEMENHVTINPEKIGTTFDDELRGALARARAVDGTTLASFREDAKHTAKLARQRTASPIEAPQPGDGVPVSVKDAFATHTEPNDLFPIDIRWSLLPEEQVYDIDIDKHRLVLNARYRSAVVGHKSLNIDDAPLIKSLLLLLLGDHFVGTGSGARKKREEAAWQAILRAAIGAQSAQGD